MENIPGFVLIIVYCNVIIHNNKHKAWDVLNVTLEKVSGAQLNHFPVVSDVIMDSDAELIQTELR